MNYMKPVNSINKENGLRPIFTGLLLVVFLLGVPQFSQAKESSMRKSECKLISKSSAISKVKKS